MRFVRLFVKVENMDPPVLGAHVQFLVWNGLRVQRHIVHDACYSVVLTELLVKFAIMSFINSEPRNNLIAEVGLLL